MLNTSSSDPMHNFDLAAPAAYFEAMFSDTEDPWEFRTRWYEARKRALTLANLPAARYASAYEPGCANGELAADLALRCDQLLVSDGSARAVEAARKRLAHLQNVRVLQAWLPADWPAEKFDLIVVSELAYYMGAADLAQLVEKISTSLLAGGTVLACHWRKPIAGCTFTGDEVHAQLHKLLGMPHTSRTEDADMLIDVWCMDARSVAERELIP